MHLRAWIRCLEKEKHYPGHSVSTPPSFIHRYQDFTSTMPGPHWTPQPTQTPPSGPQLLTTDCLSFITPPSCPCPSFSSTPLPPLHSSLPPFFSVLPLSLYFVPPFYHLPSSFFHPAIPPPSTPNNPPQYRRGDCEACSTLRFHIAVNSHLLARAFLIPSSVENSDLFLLLS